MDAGAGTDGSRSDVDMGFARSRVPQGRLGAGSGSTLINGSTAFGSGGDGGGDGVMGLLSIEVGDGGRWNGVIGLWVREGTAFSTPSCSFLGAERRRKVKLGSGPPSLSSFAVTVVFSSRSSSSFTSAAVADTNSSSPGGASSRLSEPSGPRVTGSTHPSSLSSSLPSLPSVSSCGVSDDAMPAVIMTRSPSPLSPARRLRREPRPLRRVARVSPTKLLQKVRRMLHRASAIRSMSGAVGGGTLMEEIVCRRRRGEVRGGWDVGGEAMVEK